MSATTKDKLEFTHAMARHTQATVRQCEALMRYAATLQRLAEDDCNVATDEAGQLARFEKRQRIKRKVTSILMELRKADPEINREYGAVFSDDPRGAVLKIRVPDGHMTDMGREGICVPS